MLEPFYANKKLADPINTAKVHLSVTIISGKSNCG